MENYILKLVSGTAYTYKLYSGTTLVSDTDLAALFATAGSAYFKFDFDGSTSYAPHVVEIINSSNTIVVYNNELTATVLESKNYKATWSANATAFDTFEELPGKTLDESQLGFLMGKIKEAGGGGGGDVTEIQLTATTIIKDLITSGTIDKTGRYLLVNDTANNITLHANASNETLDLARIDAGRQAILDVVLYENNNTYIGYYYAVLNYRDNNGGHTIHFNNSTFPSYSSITAVDSGTLAEYIQSDNYGQAPSAAAVYAHVASSTANSPQAVYASSVHSVTSTGFSVDTGYDFQSFLPTLQSKEVYVMAYIGSYQAPVHGLPAGYYKFRVNGYSDNNDIYLTYVHSDGTIFGGVCPGNSQHFNFTVTKY